MINTVQGPTNGRELVEGRATYGRLPTDQLATHTDRAFTTAEQTVAAALHLVVHSTPQPGCPGCPQDGLLCRWCELPPPDCPDTAGHDRLYRSSETAWRVRSAGGAA